MPTALEIAQTRQTEFSAGLLMAVQDRHPLFSAFDFRTVAGTSFLSLALKQRPNAASFVGYGEGFSHTPARYELREFSCSLIGGIVKVDTITEDRWNAADSGVDFEWFDMETEEKFFESVLNVEKQMIIGQSNDADGFPGAKELTPFSGGVITMSENGAKYDYERSVLNVAGTTATTASSVYSFVFGPKDCQGIIGNGATTDEFLRMREERFQFMTAPDSNGELEYHVAQMDGYIGLAVAGFNQQLDDQTIPTQFSLRRACNITADSGKTLSDAVMTKLSRMHGVGKMPNLFAMSERSGEQLASSRAPSATYFYMGAGDAATNQANQYPDPPDNWRGIPIVYPGPDVIGDTDAIES